MATKRKVKRTTRISTPVFEPEVKEVKVESKKRETKWTTVGWVLLLVGGLAHMLPTQMAPVVGWSLFGVTVQMAVGILSVIFALYYLLGE